MELNLFDKYIIFGHRFEFSSFREVKKYIRKNNIIAKQYKILAISKDNNIVKVLTLSRFLLKIIEVTDIIKTNFLYSQTGINFPENTIFFSDYSNYAFNDLYMAMNYIHVDSYTLYAYSPNVKSFENFDGTNLEAYREASRCVKFRYLSIYDKKIELDHFYIDDYREVTVDNNFIHGKPFELDDKIVSSLIPDKEFSISFLKINSLENYNVEDIIFAKYNGGDIFLHYELYDEKKFLYNEIIPSFSFRKI